MIVATGRWFGHGSLRASDEARGTSFKAQIDVSDDLGADDAFRKGYSIDAKLDVQGDERSVAVWIAADEFGTYAMTVKAPGLDVQGHAKLESEPHLGLLWSQDGLATVAFALFALPEAHGLRGYAKVDKHLWTWELSLHRSQQASGEPRKGLRDRIGNVVSLASRRKR